MTDPRKLAASFVDDVRGALGERVRAATLFGSAARGEWIEGTSDVNVLVLLDDIDAPLLARASPAARSASSGGVTPLLMDVDEWRRGADVFTIELADMQQAAVPLYGHDPVVGTPIQPHILRLQAERELRGKLVHLHSAMLMCAGDGERLGAIFVRALPSFLTYLRAALRLAGETVPGSSADVIAAGCRLTGAQPGPFREVLAARTGGHALNVALDQPLADEFNTAAERLAAWIDTHGR
jgi:hypothetical protein